MKITGKVSEFGGPIDFGVGPHEGLSLIHSVRQLPEVFLKTQPQGTTGLARRLDPSKFYIAMRWDYHRFPISYLLGIMVAVEANGKSYLAHPVDWGPRAGTKRIADLSHGLLICLGLDTDDNATITIPEREDK